MGEEGGGGGGKEGAAGAAADVAAAPVGEPQRPRMADARRLGAGGALRVQLFVSHDPVEVGGEPRRRR